MNRAPRSLRAGVPPPNRNVILLATSQALALSAIVLSMTLAAILGAALAAAGLLRQNFAMALGSLGAGWMYDRFGWAALNLAVLPLLILALVWAQASARAQTVARSVLDDPGADTDLLQARVSRADDARIDASVRVASAQRSSPIAPFSTPDRAGTARAGGAPAAWPWPVRPATRPHAHG